MDARQKKTLAGCFYAFFINGITALIIGAIMPTILADLNMGYNQGGMLLSARRIRTSDVEAPSSSSRWCSNGRVDSTAV